MFRALLKNTVHEKHERHENSTDEKSEDKQIFSHVANVEKARCLRDVPCCRDEQFLLRAQAPQRSS